MLQSYIKPNIKARDFSYKSVGFTLQVLSIFPIKHQDKQTDSGRNLIGRRTQSDRAADAIRSGGGRSTMQETDETTNKLNYFTQQNNNV